MAHKKSSAKTPAKQLKVKKTPLRDLQVSKRGPAVTGGRASAPPYVPVDR